MNAGFISDALARPESPADSLPITMLTVAACLPAAAIPAFRAARVVPETPPCRERRGREGNLAFGPHTVSVQAARPDPGMEADLIVH